MQNYVNTAKEAKEKNRIKTSKGKKKKKKKYIEGEKLRKMISNLLFYKSL